MTHRLSLSAQTAALSEASDVEVKPHSAHCVQTPEANQDLELLPTCLEALAPRMDYQAVINCKHVPRNSTSEFESVAALEVSLPALMSGAIPQEPATSIRLGDSILESTQWSYA